MATKPILYKPAPRWQFWSYLGGALLIHGVAVLAAIKHEPPPAPDMPPDSVVIGIDQQEQPPEPTPPPEEPEAPPPPPPQTVEPEFKEEQPTPPPKNKPVTKTAPIARPSAPGPMSASQAKVLALYKPTPQYPYEARAKHLTGNGRVVLSVDTASGNVSEATMGQSTGSPILDNSAVSTLRTWRFKPGAVPPKITVPITFTLSGASL
jgi:periplasmic protein TonB